MLQTDKGVMSSSRRFFPRLFPRNKGPSEKVVPEAAAGGVLTDGMSENTQSQDRPNLPGSGLPKGDWDHQPPTKKQLRYIEVLGGDSSSVGTRREASDLIDRFLRTRGRWPLDPDLLQQRGTRAGTESGGEWRSAHDSLLASLRLDLQDYVDLSLGNLRTKLSDPLGPAGSSQFQGPRELVRRAEEESKQLELCRKWGQPLVRLSLLDFSNGASDRDPKSKPVATPPQTNPGDDGSKIHWARWLGLFATFAVFVTIEAGLNIGLLMSALPGGALAAFLLAVLISTINVGGFGISAGLLLFTLRGHFGRTKPSLYVGAWGTWMLSALAFNLIAGRHREAYARVLQGIEKDPTGPVPAPRHLLPDIPFNPLAWELEALLFALLGMFLCALGFAKGFAFMRENTDISSANGQGTEEVENRGPDESAGGDGATPTKSPHDHQLFDTFTSLPQRYQRSLTDLRSEVANWYRALDQERRNVTTLLERLKVKENRQACIDTLEHAFIVAHNINYPHKIDLQSVEAHRVEKYAEPFAVTASDPEVLNEAGALVFEWRESGQAGFDKRIAAAHEEITAIWDNYTPLVLGKPERIVANGKAPPPATPRS